MNLRPPHPKCGRLPTDIHPVKKVEKSPPTNPLLYKSCGKLQHIYTPTSIGKSDRIRTYTRSFGDCHATVDTTLLHGVSNENRTHITRATIWCSTIELYQPYWVILKETIPNLNRRRVYFNALRCGPAIVYLLVEFEPLTMGDKPVSNDPL